MPLTDRIEFPDAADETRDFRVDVRIWKGKDGRRMVALDPVDDKSHTFMIQSRELISLVTARKHCLTDYVIYEYHCGRYTPTKPTHHLHHGASIDEGLLIGLGQRLEWNAWRHSQQLHEHRLPPPTPHTEWLIDR